MTARILKGLQDEVLLGVRLIRDVPRSEKRLWVVSALIVAGVLTFGFEGKNSLPCSNWKDVGDGLIVVESCGYRARLNASDLDDFEFDYMQDNPVRGMQIEYRGRGDTFIVYRVSKR